MRRYSSGEESVFMEGDVYVSHREIDAHLSDPPVARVIFTVVGDHYQGQVSPWDYPCATYPEEKSLIPIAPELKAEMDAWDAASDEALEPFDEFE